MECGIVGLPGCGKTTLFNALTGAQVSAFGGGGAGLKPNVGMANIPDPRLAVIAKYVPTKKLTYATIKFVDIPGVPAGSDAAKLNAFLGHVRQVEAVCHVVRCFGGDANPAKDIDQMDTDLVLADMQIAENGLEKSARAAKGPDVEAKARVATLEKVLPVLNEGKALRSVTTWTPADHKVLQTYGMITHKPVMFVANVEEGDVNGESAAAKAVKAHAEGHGSKSVVVCAKLEAELAEIEEVERGEMLASMGLKEPAIGPLARAVNELLGLACFYTAGEPEVRAWQIVRGATAPQAAGAIHSDIERGFIRAECFSFDDLVKHGSEKAVKEAGRLRSEGKGYVMADGDIVHFLFNV
ncbi:MAG TPA: redox-regulated ATPase YchF [Phycisphaerales bacterium]|nr:redox-regulated ATPase YchF [Phycisphaerales bacterium]